MEETVPTHQVWEGISLWYTLLQVWKSSNFIHVYSMLLDMETLIYKDIIFLDKIDDR